jgi:mRNA interferase MazF
MPQPNRGEVWLTDLGMAGKVRPCLVLSVPPIGENDRVLTTLVAHTTSDRGSGYEVATAVRFLKQGVFDAQNLVTVPRVKLLRKLGTLPSDQMTLVEDAVRQWLAL